MGNQICVFVEFIQRNKRRGNNINNGAWCIEREEANSSMGEPEIVRRAGVRINGNGIASKGFCQRDHRAAVLDESSARDGTHEHAFRILASSSRTSAGASPDRPMRFGPYPRAAVRSTTVAPLQKAHSTGTGRLRDFDQNVRLTGS